MHSARVESPATRTEARSQETMTVRDNATMRTAFRAQISRECAIKPTLPRRRASRTAVVHITDQVSLEGAAEPFAGSFAANRPPTRARAHPTKSGEEPGSSAADVPACGRSAIRDRVRPQETRSQPKSTTSLG